MVPSESKITPPILRFDVVDNARCRALLKECLTTRLTTVIAPAGSGKTTSLILFVERHRSNARFAWVTLEKTDKSAANFWAYAVFSLNKAVPELGLPESLITSNWKEQGFENLDFVVDRLSKSNKQVCLILDDYHLAESPIICDHLAYFVNHLPSNAHLVISSRYKPSFPTSRLKMQKELLELGCDALNFTLEETELFFKKSHGNAVSLIDVKNCHRLTNGWAAGLQMISLSLQKNAGLFSNASNEDINRMSYDYLFEEILTQQEDEVRRFMIDVSILDEFSFELCDAMLGIENSAEIINGLYESGLFLSRLVEPEQWYRFDSLFRNALHSQFLKTKSAEYASKLYGAASTWCENNGYPAQAIKYGLERSDTAEAIHIISENLYTVLRSVERHILLGWLSQLNADDDSFSSISVLTANTWANLLAGNARKARKWLSRAKYELERSEEIPNDSNQYKEIANIFGTIQAHVVSFEGDYAGAIEQAEALLEVIGSKQKWLKPLLMHCIGESQVRLCNFDEAMDMLSKVLIEKTVRVSTKTLSLCEIAESYILTGDLVESEDMLLRFLEEDEQDKCANTWSFNMVYILLGQIYLYQNRLLRAEEYIDCCYHALLEQYENATLSFMNLDSTIEAGELYIRYSQLKGDTEAAARWVERLYDLACNSHAPRGAGHKMMFLAGEQALRSGNIIQAKKIAQQCAARSASQDPLHRIHTLLLQADILNADADYDAAEALLGESLDLCLSKGLNLLTIQVQFRLAFASQGKGNQLDMLDHMIAALRIAKDRRLIYPFLEHDAEVKGILQQLVYDRSRNKVLRSQAKDIVSFAQDLLDLFEARGTVTQAEEVSVKLLTAREAEVYELLRVGLTRKEIADELNVSVNTVKTHISSIYKKIGASGRYSNS